MLLDRTPRIFTDNAPPPSRPVPDKRRVWGMTGWEDQSGHRYEDGSWPWAGLPDLCAWRK